LVEDPLSERLLWKEFHAGQIIMVDVEPDPESPADQIVTFTGVEGFVPPPVEELATTTGE
jgi:ATP-dependent Clp protease ATP-binding subunit ClpC